ncbi:MAG: CADD family putative folate metabolism protein [Actinomycetota bacterium]
MAVIDTIDRMIQERHLLSHPLYKKWDAGTLPKEAIQEYARQYYAFESEFPRFLSAIHSRSENPLVRKHLLENLWDEEHGEENHAELWLQFAEGMGVGRDDVRSSQRNEATRTLVETYRRTSAREPVAAGIAAIHAYEAQVPAVSRVKIDGLRKHYGIDDGRTTGFFEVHERLDVEHSGAERAMLEELAEDEPEAAVGATEDALEAWWGFLSAVDPEPVS